MIDDRYCTLQYWSRLNIFYSSFIQQNIDRKDEKHLGLVFVDSMKLVKFSNQITLGLEQVILTLIDVDCWFHFSFFLFWGNILFWQTTIII